ncbi:MAG TPA: hypothetical protein DIU35_11945 [Candidatus Latescibacteria bacterium]|nr:hypothetical protein [Candidatus Latescibacterota bacterium]
MTVIYGIIIFTTYTEYGITNDEVSHAKYGQDIVRRYTSLFQDTKVFNSANTWLLPDSIRISFYLERSSIS